MKLIPLSRGLFAQVDDEDFEWLNKYRWYATVHGRTHYARRSYSSNGVKKKMYMHREILKPAEGLMTDHKDNDGLNNQRQNLRVCTAKQNNVNKLPKENGLSKYLGVSPCVRYGAKKWRANIYNEGRHIIIGRFKTEENAAIAYNIMAEKFHGDFAHFNKSK